MTGMSRPHMMKASLETMKIVNGLPGLEIDG
jgi:hypothetical protein